MNNLQLSQLTSNTFTFTFRGTPCSFPDYSFIQQIVLEKENDIIYLTGKIY